MQGWPVRKGRAKWLAGIVLLMLVAGGTRAYAGQAGSALADVRAAIHLLSLEGTAAPALDLSEHVGPEPPTPDALKGQVVLLFFRAHCATNHERYGASTTPTLVLVDREGIVRLYHPGRMTETELEPLVRRLVARGAPSKD